MRLGPERIEIDEPGVELTQQGEFGHCMFVVLKGKATVAIDGEHVRDISVGDPFGEIAVLTSGRRTATVVSTTPMVLARIFKRDIWTIEEKNDAFAVELRRIRAAHDV